MSIHTILSQTIESEILKMKILCKFKGLNTNQILAVENQMRSFATRIVEEVGEELIGENGVLPPSRLVELKAMTMLEYSNKSVKIMIENDLKREMRTKLQKMKEI